MAIMSSFTLPQMHIPDAYAMDVEEVRAHLSENPFGHLVTFGASGLRATGTPFIFETDAADEMRLVGHMAARNRQASDLESGMAALALLAGPDAYVSPRWYRVKPDLPTWNYVAVQLRGTLEPIDDEPGRRAVLERTATVMERGRPDPWSLDEADQNRVGQLLPHIRAFRLTLERLEGARKMSQNKPFAERRNVIAGLLESDRSGPLAVAALMARDIAGRPEPTEG